MPEMTVADVIIRTSGGTIRLISRGHASRMQLYLFEPKNAQKNETCSITLEPLGTNPDTLLGVPIGPKMVPHGSRPTLTAARLPCGHCFNGMALIVHMAKNSMQCPLCRQGSRRDRLDLRLTFPNEPWMPAIESSVLAGQVSTQQEGAHAGNFADAVFVNNHNIDQLPVHAAFVLYSPSSTTDPTTMLHRLPTVSMRVRLEVLQHPLLSAHSAPLSTRSPTTPLLRYRLPSEFARMLTHQMHDMGERIFFHVHVYASFLGTVFDLAHMQCLPYPLDATVAPLSDPPSEHISFSSGGSPTIRDFLYTPSQTAIVSMLTIMQATHF
jgi:hypothetical protein